LMPPYCTTRTQLRRMVSALAESLEEVFPPPLALSAPGS
jgi:adenosylmethionine-8-amino-7-oxononanoate aminotransferase